MNLSHKVCLHAGFLRVLPGKQVTSRLHFNAYTHLAWYQRQRRLVSLMSGGAVSLVVFLKTHAFLVVAMCEDELSSEKKQQSTLDQTDEHSVADALPPDKVNATFVPFEKVVKLQHESEKKEKQSLVWQTLLENTVGTIFNAYTVNIMKALCDLFTDEEQDKISGATTKLRNLSLELSGARSKDREELQARYTKVEQEVAETILPVIDARIKEHKDKDGEKLSDYALEQLEILKVKLQPALHRIEMEDICGHEDWKQELECCVVLPFRNRALFTGIRQPVRGILFYGPPGTGKTMFARALATKAGMPFYQCSYSDLMSRYFGDSERRIRAVFEAARKEPNGAIVFIDEVDSIAPSRDSSGIHNFEVSKINELLHQMDGVKLGNTYDKVVVICATNRPWALDSAMKRRLPLNVYLGPPGESDRREFVEHLVKTNPGVFQGDVSSKVDSIVSLTDGYSFSAMDSLFREAARRPILQALQDGILIEQMKSDQVQVKLEDIREAASRVKKDIDSAQLERFRRWNAGEDVDNVSAPSPSASSSSASSGESSKTSTEQEEESGWRKWARTLSGRTT
eukprot:gnl/MRDRNA2_/MRDRNA2_133371_c0_seq1.p1 gnl/MRDRNA2_/MRDRNA2_133371_c0~~gnl/MRDRNA2_/MRDRNA2_133371_c0_seq1.p1  ORF type:complete len:570 (+),score=111.18 gnl/MRDRNA2_/MRDRNA2_133371_c0_seq1:3-1712(+)